VADALGAGLGLRQAWGCYGAGSLANTVLPARIGDGVRIALFARYLPGAGRGWRSGGACLWVATARGLVFGAVCTGAIAGGLLPGWTIVIPALGLAVLAGAAACLKGRTSPPPQPRLLLAWAGLSATARVAAGVCVLSALGAPRPVTSALIGLAALGASAAVPLAPGGAGLAGAGMALALGHSGVPPSTAAAAAVTFHALETLAGVAFGATGWLALRFTADRQLAPKGFELVADPVARLDEGVPRAGAVELLAELLDEDVHGPVPVRLATPPEALEQLVP
jgi:Lysylphosphatidylglycerol synthase TM region